MEMIEKMQEVLRLMNELSEENSIIGVNEEEKSFHMFSPRFFSEFQDYELYTIVTNNGRTHYRARTVINGITIFCCLTEEEFRHYSALKGMVV